MDREQMTIRLPAELKEQIQREADRLKISFNSALIILVQKSLGSE